MSYENHYKNLDYMRKIWAEDKRWLSYHRALNLLLNAWLVFGIDSHQYKRAAFVARQREYALDYPQFA